MFVVQLDDIKDDVTVNIFRTMQKAYRYHIIANHSDAYNILFSLTAVFSKKQYMF